MFNKNDYIEFPENVLEVIEYLDRNYRWTNPKLDESERSIWERIGQRKLIDSLKDKWNAKEQESKLPQVTAKGKLNNVS